MRCKVRMTIAAFQVAVAVPLLLVILVGALSPRNSTLGYTSSYETASVVS